MEDEKLFQLSAMVVFAIAVCIQFKKGEKVTLYSFLLTIIGLLLMIYSKL